MINRVSVIGLGKLGSPMAAIFASRGFYTIGVDLKRDNVEAICEGRAPVREPGLADLIAAVGENLTATTIPLVAVKKTDASFVIVPTPSQKDGTFSNRYVLDACVEIGHAIADKGTYHLVVITSTVMPGSTDGPIREALEAGGAVCGHDFGLCYSPEFIALGNVIGGLLRPDAVLIGSSDPLAAATLAEVYKQVCENDPPIAIMDTVSAEVAKLCLNCFLTAKISFANFVGWLCRSVVGANSHDVMNFIGLDSRISPKYLRPGPPYGGPCFPRDNRALSAFVAGLDMPADLPEAVHAVNEYGVERIVGEVKTVARSGDVVAVLGLAYKPDTHVTEDSPSLALIEQLIQGGFMVAAHDPLIPGVSPVQDAIANACVVVLMLPYPGFAELPFRAGQVVIDCWGIVKDVPEGVRVIHIGEG